MNTKRHKSNSTKNRRWFINKIGRQSNCVIELLTNVLAADICLMPTMCRNYPEISSHVCTHTYTHTLIHSLKPFSNAIICTHCSYPHCTDVETKNNFM